MNSKMNGWMENEMDKWTGRMVRWLDGWKDVRLDRWLVGWSDVWKVRWMDLWMERCMGGLMA